MGRIRTTFVKRTSRKIMEKYGKKFTINFETNKELLDNLVEIGSKQLRNKIAGCITKMKKLETKDKKEAQ